MKKITIIFLIFLGNIQANSQAFWSNFYLEDELSDTCNAYVGIDNNWPEWQTSHGSVNIKKEDLLLGEYYAHFEAKNTDGVERSEGIFSECEFKCGRQYEIIIKIGATTYNNEYFEVCAANNLYQRNDICSLGKIPSTSLDSTKILKILDESVWGKTTTVVDTFRPDDNYKYLWLLNRVETSNSSSEFYVSSINIYDIGKWDTIAPTTPELSIYGSVNHIFSGWYSIRLSWTESSDNACLKGYYINNEQLLTNNSQRDTVITFWVNECQTKYFHIEAVDFAGNISERSTVSYTRPIGGVSVLVLNKDFTNKKRTIKEATQKVKLNPGFKFYANPTNEYFIARIAQCSNSKNDSIVQDSVKKIFCFNKYSGYNNKSNCKNTI